jgi:hypothetical protein
MLKILQGLYFSIPTIVFIVAAFISNREPGSWILIGIALIFGFPWNIFIALPVLYLLYNIYLILCKYIEFLPFVQINGYHLLYLWVISAAIIGAHLNGIILVSLIERRTIPESKE